MVPIATYRDERKLLVLIGTVIAAAVVTLVQVDAARNGKASVISQSATSAASAFQTVVSTVAFTTRDAATFAAQAPTLVRANSRLENENDALRRENQVLSEQVAEAPGVAAYQRATLKYPSGVQARVIGYPPENDSHVITINKGSRDGLARDAGVIAAEGVVGRVVEVAPFTSKVLLLTDYTSNVPAVVQRGRWWGIAKGTLTRINVTYISQDAKLKIGDRVVTGEGNVFAAGLPLGQDRQNRGRGFVFDGNHRPCCRLRPARTRHRSPA